MYNGYYSSFRRYCCINIIINEDEIVENNEIFDVILSENSSRLAILPGRNVTQITIIEDDDCKSNITKISLYLLSYLLIVVNIGFQSVVFITQENLTAVATVCAQIYIGSLEREVVTYLNTTSLMRDTAVGKYIILYSHYYNN